MPISLMVSVFLLLLTPALFSGSAAASQLQKYSGTYRIEDWKQMEAQGLHHFFYLHPQGYFLLGAVWPEHEVSRFAGRWYEADGRITLQGKGWVDTNQGRWEVRFERVFHVSVTRQGVVLKPVPDKNRFGLIGWPNRFRFYLPKPAPNLPGQRIPRTEADVLKEILVMIGGK